MARDPRSPAGPPAHLAEQYIADVLGDGVWCEVLGQRVPMCRYVRWAVERHVRDLDTGHQRGLYFDRAAAERACDFFHFLRHSKGEFAGQPFVLEGWQAFILWCLFGWRREVDGSRRFRVAYEEIPRKNGKSTKAAGVGLYLFDADGEPGAEVYSAATKEDQAKIVWSEAKRMVQSSQSLRRRIKAFRKALICETSNSTFQPLGSDSDTQDGLNVHAAMVDEVHAHKTRDMWDVLDTGMGARRQPLLYGITTAGIYRHSICWELRNYAISVLRGVIEDDAFFGIIYTIDTRQEHPELLGLDEAAPEGSEAQREDDWREPLVWAKANPNLGVSCKLEDLQRQALKAINSPASLTAFLLKRLNVWTQAETRWVNLAAWDACAGTVNPDGLRGRVCYGGLDLSSTTDLTAFALCFPPDVEGEPYQFLWRFYVPQDSMTERIRRDKVPYDVWVRQGYVTATPGATIDRTSVLAGIREDAERYDLREIAYDRWGAVQIAQDLQDEFGEAFVVGFGQGFASMSGPMKELERLYLNGELRHGGNPVARWNADNLVARMDPAENIKPDKSKSVDRIDGIPAAIMALDRALRCGQGGRSIYEDRGVVAL